MRREASDVDSLLEECRKLRPLASSDGMPSSLAEAIKGDSSLSSNFQLYLDVSRDLIGTLVSKYSTRVTLPRNVSISEFKMSVWPDIINRDLGLLGLALYAWFPFSIRRGDGKAEYEPIELVFRRLGNGYKLLFAYARVHYDLCEYNLSHISELTIRFLHHGHTPFIDGVGYIRVRCPKVRHRDVHLGRKYWDRIWLGTALAFMRLVPGYTVPLELLTRYGRVRLMECPDGSLTNPFEAPILPRSLLS